MAEKIRRLIRYHLHILLYTYFWFGIFVCGLAAPEDRVKDLGSAVITQGWHLSLLSLVLILPAPVLYVLRMKKENQDKD